MKGGFVIVNKPVGVSSFKALSSVKKHFDTRKVGHLGTLDPLAEGVLPVAIEEGTKLIPYVETEPKTYKVEIYFGQSTETLDREGLDLDNLVEVEESFGTEDLTKVLESFVGEIGQLPPKFSALKVDGRRAYDLARSGQDFELKKRLVKVFSVKILSFNWPIAKVEIECGSGFYVRSLVRDIGEKLNVPCFMYSLIRTKVGAFDLKDSSDELELIDESIVLKKFVRADFNKSDFEKISSGIQIDTEIEGLAYGYFEGKLFCVIEGMNGKLNIKKNLKI